MLNKAQIKEIKSYAGKIIRGKRSHTEALSPVVSGELIGYFTYGQGNFLVIQTISNIYYTSNPTKSLPGSRRHRQATWFKTINGPINWAYIDYESGVIVDYESVFGVSAASESVPVPTKDLQKCLLEAQKENDLLKKRLEEITKKYNDLEKSRPEEKQVKPNQRFANLEVD